MASQELKNRKETLDNLIRDERKAGLKMKPEYADAYFQYGKYALYKENDVDFALENFRDAKISINKVLMDYKGYDIWTLEKLLEKTGGQHKLLDLFYEVLLYESFWNLESFIFYMEKKRPQDKRFYLPRRKTLKVLVPHFEDLINRKIKFLGISLPSRTGKSTMCIFVLAWLAMKRPRSHSAMGGHSGELAKGFYKELLNLFATEEYTFAEIYEFYHPGWVCVYEKSAESYTITLAESSRFGTITCRGADATWTGAVDVSWDGLLYIDDLVRDRQHSLSPKRMEETFQEYQNKMVDRKSGFMPEGENQLFAGSCELMVGTLWNVMDPLERMRKMHEGDPLYRFIRIPALDENDESNFDYEMNGFTTEYYREMRERLDDADWQAKYQQRPYAREGLLYQVDELRYFNGILPDGDSRVVAVVDVAWGGGDNLSMPVGREYENGDVYIFDWIYSNGTKETTVPLVVGQIINNEIRQCRFEGNVGGAMYSSYIDEQLAKQHYKCSCTEKKAPNKMSKQEKIIAYSGDIKRKFIFLTDTRPTQEELANDARNGVKRYVRSNQYQKAMEDLAGYVTIGKNEHDDAPDSLTQLEMFIDGDGTAKVEAIKNPFRYGGMN